MVRLSTTQPASVGSGLRPQTGISGVVVKIILLGLVNAFGLFMVSQFFLVNQVGLAGVAILGLVVINVIYWRRGGLAAKYLTPGLVFLLVFQVFVIIYTVIISFTNSGTGHNVSKDSAIESIINNSIVRVEDSPTYDVRVLEQGGNLFLLATSPDGDFFLGGQDEPLKSVVPSKTASGIATEVTGYNTLKLAQIFAVQEKLAELTVPLDDNPADGYLRSADGSTAFVFSANLVYDASNDTFVDPSTGNTFVDDGKGNFVDANGEELQPGWNTAIGFANYAKALGSSAQYELLGVFVWTLTYAVSSVALTFGLGLFLAITINGLRGTRFYRSLLILPYAFPVFLSGLIWSGLLNETFGFVNQVLLGGATVPWLQDPILAKISVILVSVWFGFPYFFLVCTGALQSVPPELAEAARVDGAKPSQVFSKITLPLVLVATSPLLVAGFAFSFNDFNTIFVLTGGGPINIDSSINAGATDILITLVYKQAFVNTTVDYGLASAFAVIIFLVITIMSIFLFRRTRSLEEVY
jgi:arabinogalactan oligomer/maltooligosaccharide transport system permease protein